MFDFRQAHFEYDPYPIGLIRNVLPQPTYLELVASYPQQELFEYKAGLGDKYSLSEVNNPRNFRRFIASRPSWRDFHAHIKAKAFVDDVIALLLQHHIDLGLRSYRVVSHRSVRRGSSALSRILKAAELSARFEFSMMGADGGHILPHTDSPNKLVTLVISMIGERGWNPAWGGGTEIVRPKDVTLTYNHVNKYLGFDDVEVLKQWDFNPNQCVLFVKTFNSWHAVSPMRGSGEKALRKTLTINIEAKV